MRGLTGGPGTEPAYPREVCLRRTAPRFTPSAYAVHPWRPPADRGVPHSPRPTARRCGSDRSRSSPGATAHPGRQLADLREVPNDGPRARKENAMAERLVEFQAAVVDDEGRRYTAAAYGAAASDGLWEGWIEFTPVDGGQALRTGWETRQP